MARSIVPLSTVRPELLRDFLVARGEPATIVDWKYFDAAFARGRERGYVWLRNDKVAGFIGLIPFSLRRGTDSWECAWTCDWALERPHATPGMGILLMKEAIEANAHLAAFRGNDITQSLVPRLATRSVADAAVHLWIPLRWRPVLERVSRRIPIRALADWPALGSLPCPRLTGWVASRSVQVEAGVSPELGSLLEAPLARSWYAGYDLNYVDWQVGRCPAVESGTCYAPKGAPVQAAAVFWRSRSSAATWRAALWARPGAEDLLSDVLSETVRVVSRNGAFTLSIIVSRRDHALLHLLRRRGFIASRLELPLYLFTTHRTSQPVDGLAFLSYLATDLAYRFGAVRDGHVAHVRHT